MEARIRLYEAPKGVVADNFAVIDNQITLFVFFIDVQRHDVSIHVANSVVDYNTTKPPVTTIEAHQHEPNDEWSTCYLSQYGDPFHIITLLNVKKIYTIKVESIGVTQETRSREYCDFSIDILNYDPSTGQLTQ
jgi:hypothetical protein